MSFGLIFHWGLYSVPSYDDPVSATRRRTQNGSEWYLKRLTETGKFRPISGWRETQAYHERVYGSREYATFAEDFGSAEWDPADWMKLAVEVGASYVVLTTKHHDGFCLWDAREDYVCKFVDSARAHGLRVGLYFSWSEFNRSCTKVFLNEVMKPHFEKLLSYEPDLLWFDGHWALTTKIAASTVHELVVNARLRFPNLEVNDRLPDAQFKSDKNYLGDASYRVYEDRALPAERPAVPWEHVNTIGLSWGYNTQQRDSDFKTGVQLDTLRGRVVELGGRVLLNLGPKANGDLEEREIAALRAMQH